MKEWAIEKKTSPPQWFGLNGWGSSQNGHNNFIHNWCIGGFRACVGLLGVHPNTEHW